jgi:predicted nucleic acid-binding protein
MILVDSNVILDVVQRREPHFGASAAVLDDVASGRVQAAPPAHVVTTLHFIVGRYQGERGAHRLVDWLLTHFEVASVGRAELARARGFGWDEFEDRVVAAAAESSGCRQIVTRNVGDFEGSLVPAVTPEEFLIAFGVEE